MAGLEGWQGFYQAMAGAAATLTGLLFVVVTLTSGRQTSAFNQGSLLFTSPTVLHLASVLAISALALAPAAEGARALWLMTGWSLFCLLYALSVAVRLALYDRKTHWSDFWWYGAGPAATYAIWTAANLAGLRGWPHAAFALSVGLLAALLVAIRNAWDLATWLAVKRD